MTWLRGGDPRQCEAENGLATAIQAICNVKLVAVATAWTLTIASMIHHHL